MELHRYIFLVGLLYTQFTINGYDASAHISEETTRSAWAAPLGIVTAVGSNAIVGWLFTLSMLFATQVLTVLAYREHVSAMFRHLGLVR